MRAILFIVIIFWYASPDQKVVAHDHGSVVSLLQQQVDEIQRSAGGGQ